jgi:hypothetical protein
MCRLSVCPSVRLSVCLSVLTVRPSLWHISVCRLVRGRSSVICLSVYLSVCRLRRAPLSDMLCDCQQSMDACVRLRPCA